MNSDFKSSSYYQCKITFLGAIIFVGVVLCLIGLANFQASARQSSSISLGPFNCTLANGQPCLEPIANVMSIRTFSDPNDANSGMDDSEKLICLGVILVVCAVVHCISTSHRLRQVRIEALDSQYKCIHSDSETPSVPTQESEQDELYCPYCGATCDSEDVYCSKCGKQIWE
jgi:DNA-directed RNA polymerase subunit RPC12/RpoP